MFPQAYKPLYIIIQVSPLSSPVLGAYLLMLRQVGRPVPQKVIVVLTHQNSVTIPKPAQISEKYMMRMYSTMEV